MDANQDFLANLNVQFEVDPHNENTAQETEELVFVDQEEEGGGEGEGADTYTEEQKQAIQNCEQEIFPKESNTSTELVAFTGGVPNSYRGQDVLEEQVQEREANAVAEAEEAEEAEGAEGTEGAEGIEEDTTQHTEDTTKPEQAKEKEQEQEQEQEQEKKVAQSEAFKKKTKDSVKNKGVLRKHTYKKTAGGISKSTKNTNSSQKRKYLKKPSVVEANTRFKTLKQHSKPIMPVVG